MTDNQPESPDGHDAGHTPDPTFPFAGEEAAGGGRGHRRSRPAPRRTPGCLAALIALVIIGGGLWWGGTQGLDLLRGALDSEAEDYPGPGHGQVTVEVAEGDSATAIGTTLEEEGVVASVDAFVAAANASPEDAAGIQVGHYQLKKEMAAADALDVLIDPANMIKAAVTIPEGLTVDQTVVSLAKQTDYGKQRFRKLLRRPERIGLPAQANGDPEGYLFPATYDFGPNTRPREMLTAMTDRWKQAAEKTGLTAAADRLGRTPHELMTIASLIEAESREPYMAKVSRVIYNRLEDGMKLQLDATVNYAHGEDIGARTTSKEREIDSPYNTYQNVGLPPGPIEAPGEAAMAAAVEPEKGDWLFYVTVNLATGETKFAETLEEHNANVEELNQYCRNESERC